MTLTHEQPAPRLAPTKPRPPLARVFAWSFVIIGFLSGISTLTNGSATISSDLTARIIDIGFGVLVNGGVWAGLITGGVAIYRRVRPAPGASSGFPPPRPESLAAPASIPEVSTGTTHGRGNRALAITAAVLGAVLVLGVVVADPTDNEDSSDGLSGDKLNAILDGTLDTEPRDGFEADLEILGQLQPAIQDWNASLAPLIADLNDQSVSADQWVSTHNPTIAHVGDVVTKMQLTVTSGPESARALGQPFVDHYAIEVKAISDLRDAYVAQDRAAAEDALNRLQVEAPRARELGCGLLDQLRGLYGAATVDREARDRGLDQLCS